MTGGKDPNEFSNKGPHRMNKLNKAFDDHLAKTGTQTKRDCFEAGYFSALSHAKELFCTENGWNHSDANIANVDLDSLCAKQGD